MGAGHAHRLYRHGHSPVHALPPHTKLTAVFAFVLVVVSTPREAMWAFAAYAGLLALLLNLTVAVTGTAVLERLGVPRGADATDLPSRLTVRRRPETGASNP